MNQPPARLWWHDFETGRSGFTDSGELPDGPLVEEITSTDYWERTGICVCGKDCMDDVRCRYGASHRSLGATDDEALQ